MTITIFINQQAHQIKAATSLQTLQHELGLPTLGCVFAINQQVIPKGLWSETLLNQGDQIALFQAIAGG
ncbi:MULTISPECIES: sulfur carrier protein ThiS [Gammaproteobacteria]|uniref:Sulfur carrier protein ThiS n=1 Tax=Vibrio ostreae TaxID=2841925 RepID=A0A975YNE1_9VIBR|nr:MULTISPECIES: sulfur carrier protein ThiS [Vibrio]QXO17431.1 sulfur carrier protein ThiS [Vibrio ostreae]